MVEKIAGQTLEFLERIILNGSPTLTVRELQEIHDVYHHSVGGPSVALGAVIAIAVGLALPQMGVTLGMKGMAGVAMQKFTHAAFAAICTQSSINVVANKGNPNAAARGLSTNSILRAGVKGLFLGGGGGGADLPGRLMAAAHQAVYGAAIDAAFGDDIGEAFKRNAVSAGVGAAAGWAAEKIGALRQEGAINGFVHKLMHGAVGGAAGAALGGEKGAAAGALGAVVAETMADFLREDGAVVASRVQEKAEKEGIELTSESFQTMVREEMRGTVDMARLGAALGALLLEHDVDIATWTATMAVENNFMTSVQCEAMAAAAHSFIEAASTVSADLLEDAAAFLEDYPDAPEIVAGALFAFMACQEDSRGAGAPARPKAPIVKEGLKSILKSPRVLRELARKIGGKRGDTCGKKFESKFWNRHETHTFLGQSNKVYKRDDLIDLGRVDPKGRTSLELMQRGQAPVGPDKLPINLHHMTQTQGGPIAEVTSTMHTKHHRILHIWTNQSKGGVTRAEKLPEIDRAAFDKWRSEYWKTRASELTGVK